MAGYYTRELIEPKTKQDGLCNCLQLAINQLEAGKPTEALYVLVDLLDDVRSNANPYEIGRKPARKSRRPKAVYHGDVNTD